MNSKLLKISILYDRTSDEPARIRMIDNETGHGEEICGSLESIKSRVYQVLESWHREGRGALTPEVCEYYAAYADYEARCKAAEGGSD
jgi:hypothetical protein